MKYYVIINVCDLHDCRFGHESIPAHRRPSVLYWSREDAERELLRLANRTGDEFLLFEAVATAVRHGDAVTSAYIVEDVQS